MIIHQATALLHPVSFHSQAWPGSGRYGLLVPLAAAVLACWFWFKERRSTAPGAPGSPRSGWARPTELRPLLGRGGRGERVVLGKIRAGLLSAEPLQSLVVFGPSQSRKTSGLAIPAILEWKGPILATSVKADLLAQTLGWRSAHGPAWVFDPTGSTSMTNAEWSPLQCARTWAGARRIATSLCMAAKSEGSGITDADFWYASAAKLLAPMFLAATIRSANMADVVNWVDRRMHAEALSALEYGGHQEALQALRAVLFREERQLSSVFATAEAVLEPFAEPWAPSSGQIDIEKFLNGSPATLYVCAPSHDQRRLRPVFATLISEVLRSAYALSLSQARPLSPPLLVVLDEAANIAPLSDLDSLASTAAGHGIQLISVWQDLSQLRARYGERAATVVNNHRAKLVLSGISDPPTLEYASALAGHKETRSVSWTRTPGGQRSATTAPERHQLAPPDSLRRMRPGTALLLYGHLPPARVRLRPYWEDPGLARRADMSKRPDARSRPGPSVPSQTERM